MTVFGPTSEMAEAASKQCATWVVVGVAGPLVTLFGVCSNQFAPADGRLRLGGGCGAHSEVLNPPPTICDQRACSRDCRHRKNTSRERLRTPLPRPPTTTRSMRLADSDGSTDHPRDDPETVPVATAGMAVSSGDNETASLSVIMSIMAGSDIACRLREMCAVTVRTGS